MVGEEESRDHRGVNFKNINFADQSSMEDYILRSKLGESSVSTVWKAERRTTGEVVAVKKIQLAKLTRHLRNCLECEVKFLSSVNHPNIIRLLDCFTHEGYIVLVLEFCAGGNLASYIHHHGQVQECIARRLMQQLGAGLKVLKQNYVVHRDLKPENLLLSCSGFDPVLKIADFGYSRILLPNETVETVCGSRFYMAPEILQFQRYNEKVDMWSTGAILFELVNGYPPFKGRSHVQCFNSYIRNVLTCVHDYYPPIQMNDYHLRSFLNTISYKNFESSCISLG